MIYAQYNYPWYLLLCLHVIMHAITTTVMMHITTGTTPTNLKK